MAPFKEKKSRVYTSTGMEGFVGHIVKEMDGTPKDVEIEQKTISPPCEM